MTKFKWSESMKLFRNHVDPEKEEQLRWISIGNTLAKQVSFEYDWRLWNRTFEAKSLQFKAPPLLGQRFPHHGRLLWYSEHWRLRQMDTKVKRILKLIKSINYGNREANLKKRAEVIQLIEDFHKQYESLYALYDDLKEGVKKRCTNEEGEGEDGQSSPSSSSSLESASFYSPGSESKTPLHDPLQSIAQVTKEDVQSEKSDSPSSSLEDTGEVVKEALSVERVSGSYEAEGLEVEGEEERSRNKEKLNSEVKFLREKLDEREKINQALEKKSSTKIKELEDKMIALNLEIEALNYQKGELEEKLERKEDDVHKRSEENLELRSRVSELEVIFKEKEEEVSNVLRKLEDSEKVLRDKIDESMEHVQNLQMEVNSLRSQKDEVRERLASEKEKQVELLRLQKTKSDMEVERLRMKKSESEMELEKKAREVSDSLVTLESLKEKLKQKSRDEEHLIEERDNLKRQVNELETGIVSIKDEARKSKSENEKQRTIVSHLQGKLKEKEDQISALEKKMEAVERDMSNEIKAYKQKHEMLEIDFIELEGKNDLLAATLEEREELINKLKEDSKANFRITERKMEEMVEEFRKQSEDSIRILGRRIRVAEQLHLENKEWYMRTKDKYEQDQKDNEIGFQKIKIITETVNDVLTETETFGLKFAECCEHFMNRISKVSCEINFVKDWVKRKNGAIAQVKEDLDTLLVQLDDKETEILGSRQKIWKLENRVRELEKMVLDNEEGMLVLKEEKREAIRQLCVWIDYHRGRSDFLKKAFSEFHARNQRNQRST